MKNKLLVLLLLLPLSFMAGIAYVGWIAPRNGLDALLIAIPKISGGGISVNKLEEINENIAMLTYRNVYDKSVAAQQSNYNCVLIGTNDTYPYVMHYSTTDGGFFSKKAMDNKHRLVVLNEKAAFDIFGTLNAVGNEIQIDRTSYIVTGVMNDRDTDNKNVYIPASYLAESVETVILNLSLGNGLTEEYTQNELKHVGINEMNYNWINLGMLSAVIKNNVFVSFEIALFGLVLLITKRTVIAVYGHWKACMQLFQGYYLMELLHNEIRMIKKLILLTITAIGMITAEFAITLDLFVKYLGWNRAREAFNSMDYIRIAVNALQTEKMFYLSNTLLIGFIIAFAILTVVVWDWQAW